MAGADMFKNKPHWMDRAFWIVAPIVVVASAARGMFYYLHSKGDKAEVEATPEEKPPVAADEGPAIRHPVPAAAQPVDEPLPPLDESDARLRPALEGLFGSDAVQR